AGRKVRREVHDEGALRRPARRPRRLLGLHHQRGRREEARRSQQGRGGDGTVRARGLEGRATDGPQEEPELLQEGAAARLPGDPARDPRRGEHRSEERRVGKEWRTRGWTED